MPRKSRLIQDEDRQPIMCLFRHIAANDPGTLESLEDFDWDLQRSFFNGQALLKYENHPLFKRVKHIDFTSKKNANTLLMLVRAALQFQELRPVLLHRWSEKWKSQVVARQENQRALQRAAIEAVCLRAALEDTSNVLMSWDSLQNLIKGITGSEPGRQSLARLFAWFDSGESPFEVIRKGKRGKFGASTTLKVTMPELTELDEWGWDWATNLIHQHWAKKWLADTEQAYSDLVDDEIQRRKERPERKSRYAARSLDESLAMWGELDLVNSLSGSSNPGTGQATSLSNITNINEEEIPAELPEQPRVEPQPEPSPVPVDWFEQKRRIWSGEASINTILDGLDLSFAADGEALEPTKPADPYSPLPQEKILA